MSETDLRQQNRPPAIGTSLKVITALSVLAGVALRFWTRGDLWLDEALSVNISSLPIGDIGGALRHDGHPPLYYYILHFWMELGGSGDWWIRSLSAVFSLLSLPVAYIVGLRAGQRAGAGGLGARRLALIMVALFAVMPYGIRYSSEARMYSLTSLLMLVGYLLVNDLLAERQRGPDAVKTAIWGPSIGLALVTAAMLYTHYWAIWVGIAVGSLAIARAVRAVDPRMRRRAIACTFSLIAGVVLFLPWLPTMLYQSEHTGTPWGEVFRPATMLVVTITDFVGGGFGELQLVSYLMVAAVGVALVGVLRQRAGQQVVELTATPQMRILPEFYVFMVTVGVGWVASVFASATYAARYASVIYPLFVLMVAAGIAMARSTKLTAVMVGLAVASSVVGVGAEITLDRTQAGQTADLIGQQVASGGKPTVVVCPDQLGPATQRALDSRGIEANVIPFPSGGDPRFVDWADYAERNAAADPSAFANEYLADLSPTDPVFVVMSTSYLTFEGKCEGILSALTAMGHPIITVESANPDFFESMGLWSNQP